MLEFVEGALKRSAPGKAFALGVMVALPAVTTSTSAATLATATVKGIAGAKSAAGLGLIGGLLGPVLGFLGGYIGAKSEIEKTRSPRERRFMVGLSWGYFALAVGVVAPMLYLSLNAPAMLSAMHRCRSPNATG